MLYTGTQCRFFSELGSGGEARSPRRVSRMSGSGLATGEELAAGAAEPGVPRLIAAATAGARPPGRRGVL